MHAFVDESERPGRYLMRIAALPIRANIYQQPGKPVAARETCLRTMAADFLDVGVTRLVIEPVDGLEHRDQSVLINEMQRLKQPHGLVYEYLAAHLEPNLWAADAIAWAYGAGGDWRRRVWHLLDVHPRQRETRAPAVRRRPGFTS